MAAANTCEAERKESETVEEASKTREFTEEEKRQVLYEFHDALLGAHQGVACTVKRIRRNYDWPNLTRDVENYISKCALCQKNKLVKKCKAPKIITDTPTEPFEKYVYM